MKLLRLNKLGALSMLVSLFVLLNSCDSETGALGISVMPSNDQTQTSQAVYDVFTKSIKADALSAYTSECYLGRVTDPETNATTTCDFLAQFYQLENYKLPVDTAMYKENGEIVADSVLLNLYIKSYYGDSINSMKIGIYELDKDNIMEDGVKYDTDIDPSKYVSNAVDAEKKEVTFAVTNFEIDDTIRYASNYSKNIRIKLSKDYGTKILQTYYKHPEYFKNSYSFIRNVVPGFYFKTLAGNGTMVDIDVTTLTIFFRYKDGDSTYVGLQRVAATDEVIQNNHIENTGIDELVSNDNYTFLKTPAGIFTEVSLPINDIFKGHESDSINSAKIVFPRQNNSLTSSYNLPVPQKILMVRKSVLKSFFESRSVPNDYTSFVTTFSSANNSYTFNNIANLVTFLHKFINKEAGISSTDNDATRQTKISAYEATNPDWNKVVLIPVTTNSNSSGVIINTFHDFSLASTKLVGGKTPVNMSIIYSSFNK